MPLNPELAAAAGWATAFAGWRAAHRIWPTLWVSPVPEDSSLPSPGRELFWLLAALACTVALLAAGYQLAPYLPLTWPYVSVLQVGAIFAAIFPTILYFIIRKPTAASALVPTDRLAARAGIGLVLAGLSASAFAGSALGASSLPRVALALARGISLDSLILLAVLDLLHAMLFVRLSAVLGSPAAVCLMAALSTFLIQPARGMAPVSIQEFSSLLLLFAVFVAGWLAIRRSADMLWFFIVHVVMVHVSVYVLAFG